ncbi:MAG: NUDIX domain-containing protein [Chlamydiae bacterium]|nr:NUDIX domain-containing protein [Chlamydiota bacterium]
MVIPTVISAVVISAKKKEFLLLRRSSEYLYGSWQYVTGKIEKNETAIQAAQREVFEETGLLPNRFYAADTVEIFYLKEENRVLFSPVFVAVLEDEQEVKLTPKEHDACEWLSLEKAKEKVIFAEQKRVLNHVNELFIKNTPNNFHLIEKTYASIKF